MSSEKKFSRRDFLKLAGLLPLGLAAPRLLKVPSDKKNILVIVFDAWSARNTSLYGYRRQTTPNIDRLAERAIVYHRHYAGGNFTTTGTAALLTGTNAWTHRALEQNATVLESLASHNIFNLLNGYHRIAYTHNEWVGTLLRQFQNDIEEWIPREQLLLASYGNFIPALFKNDPDIASVSWTRSMAIAESGYAYSLFFSRFLKSLQDAQIRNIFSKYPRKLPTAGGTNYYILEQAMDWLGDRLTNIQQPFLGYFHFLPPHAPYRTSIDFYKRFAKDKISPIQKPFSVFSRKQDQRDLHEYVTEYDEFILYADHEFGRLYDALETSGTLENTIIVLTADHGEINDRGIRGHLTGAMYEPLLHIPLLIFEPGRKTRLDIKTPTSAIDLLPTLLHLSGQTRPDWAEGVVLPPFNSTLFKAERSLYALRAIDTQHDQPINQNFSVSLVKGRYKLHYYFGYEELDGGELVQLFDIESDPEELNDLSATQKEISDELLAELKAKLAEVNKPYL